MRARTLLLLLLAVVLAGGTAFLARSYLAAQRTQEVSAPSVPVQTPARSVMVARADIKRGQILRPEDTTWQTWPEGALDKNYIVLGGPPVPPRTPESFTGWVAKNPIAGGEPITENKIIAPGNRGFLAAVLRPGMKAMSVPVTITSGISGFIFPGDYVDLILTYAVPNPPAPSGAESGKQYEHKAAETMLHAVRVVAIDQRLESKAGEAVPAHTATFEVTGKQSEAIALASEIGKLSLSLCSLVPAPGEPPIGDQPVGPSTSQNPTDSSIGAASTYTMDSEVSPLLPKTVGGPGGTEALIVTILRGGGKASESSAPQSASKGS